MLLADEDRIIANFAQRVDELMLIIAQREAAMGEAHHTIAVRVLAG